MIEQFGYFSPKERLENQVRGASAFIANIQAHLDTHFWIPEPVYAAWVHYELALRLPKERPEQEKLIARLTEFFQGAIEEYPQYGYLRRNVPNRAPVERDFFILGLLTGILGEPPLSKTKVGKIAGISTTRVKQIESYLYAKLANNYIERTEKGKAQWEKVQEEVKLITRKYSPHSG